MHVRVWRMDSGISITRHSPFGLPLVTLKQPKATFQAISVSGPRVVLRAGRIARPNRPIRPFKAPLDAFSDTPFLSPALDLPAGSMGAVAVYSEHWHPVAIVRKVLLRMKAWTYYLSFEH